MPLCSLVVLFDLKPNLKSFIQSRGRARHQGACLALDHHPACPAGGLLVSAIHHLIHDAIRLFSVHSRR